MLFSKSVYATILPPEAKTVAEWAEKKRRLGSVYSARPGRWDNTYTPYLVEPMNLFGSYHYPRVVLMTGAQVGKSEVGINAILRTIDDEPCSMLLVLPTLADCMKWSRGRLRDAIGNAPGVNAVIPKPNSRKDGSATALDIRFPGGSVQLVGANSSTGLSSTPVRVLYLDEIDRYPGNTGGESGEGDPVALAEARTASYRDRAILYTSTPAIKGISRIEQLFDSGDKRRWHCDCLSCGHRWVWKFDLHVKFENRDPKTARLLCPECGTLHDQAAVRRMSDAGQWIATADKPHRPDTASFAIWAIHSPWVTMADIVQGFLDAKRQPEQLQVFVNTVLGESWEQPGESIDFDAVSSRRDTYSPETLPPAVLVLTASVDIQLDRLELYVCGWNEAEGHYGITHEVHKGDPERRETWEPLVEMVRKRRYHTADGREMRVASIAVDMSYKPDSATKGVNLLKQAVMKGGRAVGVKGSANPGMPKVGQIYGKSLNRRKRGSGTLSPTQVRGYWIGVNAIKDLLQHRLTLPAEEGGWQWGEGFANQWFKQLSSEHRVLKRIHGKVQRLWVKRPGHFRNEALDLAVYSYAALQLLKPSWPDLRIKPPKKTAEGDNIAAAVPEQPTPDSDTAEPPKPRPRRIIRPARSGRRRRRDDSWP